MSNKKKLINNKNAWDLGSIFILKGDNNHIKESLVSTVDSLAKKFNRSF